MITRFGRALGSVLALAMVMTGAAMAQGWAGWTLTPQDYPKAEIWTETDDQSGPRVIVVTADAIEAAGLVEDVTGNSPDEAVAQALSVLWIDTQDIGPPRALGQRRFLFEGEAETEYGKRRFAAIVNGRGAERVFTVLLAAPSDYRRLGGGDWLADEAAAAATRREQAPERRTQMPSVPQSTRVPPPVYVETDDQHVIPGWTNTGKGWVAPGGADAARLSGVLFDPGEVDTPQEAIAETLKVLKIDAAARVVPAVEVKAHRDILGPSVFVSAGTSRRAGSEMSLFIYVRKADVFQVSVLEAPTQTYQAWGGVMAMLVTFGVLDSADEMGADLLAQARGAGPREQAEVFALVFDYQITATMNALMMTQMGTLNMMMDFNADLQTQTSCIMTDGCVIGTGANGEAVMTFPND